MSDDTNDDLGEIGRRLAHSGIFESFVRWLDDEFERSTDPDDVIDALLAWSAFAIAMIWQLVEEPMTDEDAEEAGDLLTERIVSARDGGHTDGIYEAETLN